MSSITISGKTIGQTRPLFADWSIALPPECVDAGGPITLRDIIRRVVTAEVEAFQRRQHDRQFIRALTARDIETGVERGKIDMGGHNLTQSVDMETAVAAACQAFEDGIFLVIVDECQQRELEGEVYLRPDSRVTFVRLTLLAGG